MELPDAQIVVIHNLELIGEVALFAVGEGTRSETSWNEETSLNILIGTIAVALRGAIQSAHDAGEIVECWENLTPMLDDALDKFNEHIDTYISLLDDIEGDVEGGE